MIKNAKLILTDSNFNTLKILTDNLVGLADSFDGENIVFCEEKISLMTEREICQRFGGSFNTDVYSFGNFLRKNITLEKVLSKEGSSMVVKKVLGSIPLFSLKKNRLSLAPTIYDLIIQLKSARIFPEEISEASNSANGILQDKLKDVCAIYTAYEEYLNKAGYEDQSSVLSYLPEIIENSNRIKNANVFLVGFSSFTVQARNVIKSLLKTAKSVTAILVSGNNPFVFVGETAEIFANICKDQNVNVIKTFVKSDYSKEGREIVDSIFNPTLGRNKTQTNKIHLSCADNIKEEVERICSLIKNSVINGGNRYRDNTVILPEIVKYKNTIQEIFTDYDIPYFLDEKKKPITHPLVRLILSYLDIFISNFNRDYLLEFCRNPLVCESKDFLDRFSSYIYKYNINYKKIFAPFTYKTEKEEDLEKFEQFRKEICDITSEYSISNLLLKLSVKEKVENFTLTLKNLGENDESAVNEQIYEAVEKILAEMDMILGKDYGDFAELKNVFISGINALELSIIPQYNDAVFIGGFREASLKQAKNLYVLGLESSVPTLKQDVALLSDRDIDALKELKLLVEPQIRIVNKREREQTALGLASFAENLYLSYSTTDNGGKQVIASEIIGYAKRKFTISEINDRYEYIAKKQALKMFAKDCSDFAEGLTNDFTFATAFYNYDKSGKAKMVLDFAGKEIKERLNSERDILVKEDIYPTSLEDFAKCPYKYFVERALNVTKKEVGETDGAKIGNIMHSLFLEYIKNIDKVCDKESSDKVFSEALSIVYEKENLKVYTEDEYENEIIIRAIEECKKFCYKNYLWLSASSFKTEKSDLEVGFGKGGKYPAIMLYNGKVRLNGKIDRIDKADNYYRIIDYKTGKVDDADKKLFSGEKLQLYLYAGAIPNMNLAGAFYMPIADNFTKKEEKDNPLVCGKSLLDENVVKMHDKNFTEDKGSSFVPVKVVKGKYKNALDDNGLNAYVKYALKVSNKEIDAMKNGFILPSPLEDTCKYCDFKSMCGQTIANARKVKSVDSDVIRDSVNEDDSNIKGD